MKELRDLKKDRNPELMEFALPEIDPSFKIEECVSWALPSYNGDECFANRNGVSCQKFLSLLQVHIFADKRRRKCCFCDQKGH